jgi:DNA-binding response OmpR family regulator
MIDIDYIRNLTRKYFPKERVKKKKILVVDDNRDTLSIIKVILDRNDFNVSISDSSESVYKLKPSQRPDLFIIDINLKDGDGRDLCVHLKENPSTSNIPVILYTGQSLGDLKTYHNMCVPDCILSKPFTVGDLRENIVKLLNKEEEVEAGRAG